MRMRQVRVLSGIHWSLIYIMVGGIRTPAVIPCHSVTLLLPRPYFGPRGHLYGIMGGLWGTCIGHIYQFAGFGGLEWWDTVVFPLSPDGSKLYGICLVIESWFLACACFYSIFPLRKTIEYIHLGRKSYTQA